MNDDVPLRTSNEQGLPQSELEAIKKRAHSVWLRTQVCANPYLSPEEADIANLLRHIDWLLTLPPALRDAKRVRERGEELLQSGDWMDSPCPVCGKRIGAHKAVPGWIGNGCPPDETSEPLAYLVTDTEGLKHAYLTRDEAEHAVEVIEKYRHHKATFIPLYGGSPLKASDG